MNNDPRYTHDPEPHSSGNFSHAVDERVRENPTQAILIALGVGVVLGVLVKMLQPRPEESRATRLLNEIQDRLHELTDPAFQKMSSLASNGADLVKEGMDQVSDLHLNRTANRLRRRLRKLFH